MKILYTINFIKVNGTLLSYFVGGEMGFSNVEGEEGFITSLLLNRYKNKEPEEQ